MFGPFLRQNVETPKPQTLLNPKPHRSRKGALKGTLIDPFKGPQDFISSTVVLAWQELHHGSPGAALQQQLGSPSEILRGTWKIPLQRV